MIDGVVAERGLGLAARPGCIRRFELVFGRATTFMPRPPPPEAALMSTG